MRLLVILALYAMLGPALAQDMLPSFNKCLPCHAIGQDATNEVGPQLNGIVDALAGGEGGYAYSRAMQQARNDGLVWTRQTLTRYLKRPKHLIPGTSMTFYGMQDRAEIDALIDYLASFAPDGSRLAQ